MCFGGRSSPPPKPQPVTPTPPPVAENKQSTPAPVDYNQNKVGSMGDEVGSKKKGKKSLIIPLGGSNSGGTGLQV
jgi:hypothetical protein